MLELAFALAPRQNHFFVEIVDAFRAELDQMGVRSSVHVGAVPPPDPERVPVLVPPHEFFALTPPELHPAPPELERAIFLCAEQPGTWFFDEDVRLGHLHGAAIADVSMVGKLAFREEKLKAVHVPLGFSDHWACPPEAVERDREIDVLHLGIWSRRRAEAIARCARVLSRHRSHLVLSDPDGPNAVATPNFVIEQDKWSLLRTSRVLLNIHVADRPYFEWQRVVQAISNGALVVSEPSKGAAPLEAGTHYVASSLEGLPFALSAILEDEEGRLRMARAAYEHLREVLPLRRSAERLVALAEDRARLPLVPRRDVATPGNGASAAPAEDSEPHRAPARRRFPSLVDDPELGRLRAAFKDVRLQLIDQQRQLARLRDGGASVVRVATSPAYLPARPTVTVIVPMYDESACVTDALDSCAVQRLAEIEVAVVDDGSTDGSCETVQRWSAEHPGLPLILLRHPVNRGLGAARNTGIDHARAPFTFVLDADNALFPTTLERLVEALAAHEEAVFAYSMLAMEDNGAPVGLRSCFPWDPDRLGGGNYIDAMAMWRTEALRELGGYTTELALHGWEDYDLFCRVAETGRRGLLVPEVLGRYRVRAHSMLSVTDISTRAAVSMLIERHPTVMRGVEPPL